MGNPTSGWEKGSAIATWIQTFAVVASLIFIGCQLKQQIKLSRAANSQAFVALGQPLNLRMTEPDMAKLWLKKEQAAQNKAEVPEDEIAESQFVAMLANYLVFYENVFVQYQQGLVDKEVFALWDRDLENFIVTEPIESFWEKSKDAYQEQFRDHVDQLIAKKHPSPSGR